MTKKRKINTGGTMLTPRDTAVVRHEQEYNASVIFAPGCTSAHSGLRVLDPGKCWMISLTDARSDGTPYIQTLRHTGMHRSATNAENIHDKEDMFDFIRTNGFQVMQLGGDLWEMNKDRNLLIVAVPGIYSFITDDVDDLDYITVTLMEYPADEVLKYLPAPYFAGIN